MRLCGRDKGMGKGFILVPLKLTFFCVTKRTYRRLDDTPVLLCTLYGSYPISDCCDTVLWVATIRRSVFCSVATVFCKNCGNYSLIYLKSQYYFINCSFFFLSCFFTSGQVLAAFSARIPFFKKRVSLRENNPAYRRFSRLFHRRVESAFRGSTRFRS